MECRINAEDPANNFRPSPGKIIDPAYPRAATAYAWTPTCTRATTIPPNYDSMIAKLITVAQTREECIVKMKRALSEFVVEGVKTTIPFHLKLMDNAQFQGRAISRPSFWKHRLISRTCKHAA